MTEDKHIIRTSDRGTFRRCRQLWNFTSKMRMNLEYVPGIEPLNFGIAYHEAMEVYYDPILWDEDTNGALRIPAAEASFMASMNSWKKNQKASNSWNDQTAERWDELVKMGLGMMRHYWSWAKEADKHYRPVKTEIEFEVPIPVPDGMILPRGFQSIEGHLYYMAKPVVYQGRIDVIVQDLRTDRLWIMDHKTAAQFGESLAHLDLDPQCGSYAWAASKMLGLDIAGVIYSEHRKKVPKQPEVLKSGALSKNKAQSTTAEIYKQAVLDAGLYLPDYEDFIEVLRNEGQQYFRRTHVNRNGAELDSVEANILYEAIDMLNEPYIYPSPSMWNCRGCAFATPCLADQDGSGAAWSLFDSGKYAPRATQVEGDQG
ncbi:MAG: hypothetical protein E6Q97_08610 [Desulfurellales bacterium]|nr:MAG: hypothetical protein E6Q97_08610 [Desulfurellales bacterium]